MPLSNRVICSLLFREDTIGQFECNSCSCTYRDAQGFTNLMNHLRRFHPGYEAEGEAALRAENTLRLRIVDARTTDIYRWVEWVVMERLPFSFCERRLARQNSKMSHISETTLNRYIYEHVEGKITALLPDKFGLVLDGWTSGGRHYVAIFAVYDDGEPARTGSSNSDDFFDDLECPSRRFLLLAFSPVDDEEDLSAQSLFDLIADTLSRYEKPWEYVLFMVGDNCSVNQYIGRREGAIPMVGCASHRFNLAMKDFLTPEEPLLVRIHSLMRRLCAVRCRAMLRKITPLAPVMRNDTRWSSVYAMMDRYCRIEPLLRAIDHGTVAEYELESVLLSRRETERAFVLRDDLEKMEGVTKALQKSTLTLSGVRRLFHHVVAAYPQLDDRLGKAATIVNNAPLESGIVKLQRHEVLSASERAACAVFKLAEHGNDSADATQERPSFVRNAFKRRRAGRRQRYMDVGFVPPTSNECERFFSAAKLVLSDLRKSMDPSKFEAVMSLAINREHWDVYTVEAIRQQLGPNARD
ncbi:hypothetical protein BBJ28_00024862 [Nothophytophthora sp. Chile5]|nr:hypothetical protein BBJ28_00024862 [Nothophytophthora sp. Chile5]